MQKVRVIDSTLRHYGQVGNAIHWEDSTCMVTFAHDANHAAPTRLHVEQIEIVNSQILKHDAVRITDRKDQYFGDLGKVVSEDKEGKYEVQISSREGKINTDAGIPALILLSASALAPRLTNFLR